MGGFFPAFWSCHCLGEGCPPPLFDCPALTSNPTVVGLNFNHNSTLSRSSEEKATEAMSVVMSKANEPTAYLML